MKNLTAKEFSDLLIRLDACKEARTWAKGKSLAEVWSTCHRGDWLLWLMARHGDVPQKTLQAIACDCAEPALTFLPPDEKRPAECIATVRRWLKDEATLEEVKAAAYAADAAAADAAAAATYAAYAAAEAAWAARAADAADAAAHAACVARAAWAAEAAARAAHAADAAAYAADAEDARRKSLLFSADICRRYVSVE